MPNKYKFFLNIDSRKSIMYSHLLLTITFKLFFLIKVFLFQATKPIMEKRRRARINQCLSELKTLILDALNKDVSIETFYKKLTFQLSLYCSNIPNEYLSNTVK